MTLRQKLGAAENPGSKRRRFFRNPLRVKGPHGLGQRLALSGRRRDGQLRLFRIDIHRAYVDAQLRMGLLQVDAEHSRCALDAGDQPEAGVNPIRPLALPQNDLLAAGVEARGRSAWIHVDDDIHRRDRVVLAQAVLRAADGKNRSPFVQLHAWQCGRRESWFESPPDRP